MAQPELQGFTARAGSVIREEATHLAAYAGYLFVCFATIMSFAWARAGVDVSIAAAVSFAGVKALAIGHFLTMSDRLRAGHMALARPLAVRVFIRSVAALGLVVLLTLAEHVGHALVEGEAWHVGVAAFAARSLADFLATLAVTWLLFLPLITVVECVRHSSWEAVWRTVFGRRDEAGRLLPDVGEGR